MNDTTENPTPDHDVVTPNATEPTAEALPVATAAAALGITSDAIRARIRRGAMRGEKRDGAWFVYVPAAEHRDTKPDSDATRDGPKPDVNTTETDHVTTADATGNPTVATSVVDLAPLADLIERQARELAEMREAAAVWQIRARQAEEQLKQLTAGETTPEQEPEAATMAPGSTEPNETPETGLRGWWRRVLGG